MAEQLADLITSTLVLVAVVVLALADVVDGELVALAVGALLPSPTKAGANALRARRRRTEPLTADRST